VKLAQLEQQIPSPHALPKRRYQRIAEAEETLCVPEPEDGADDVLGFSWACEQEDGFRDCGEEEGADEGAGDGAGEGYVVVGVEEGGVEEVGEGKAVGEDVVGCLNVEGFFDFGVGC
jgi:hypothetical protein